MRRISFVFGSLLFSFSLSSARVLLHSEHDAVPERVPPPWTPVKVIGNSVQCWNREYVIDTGLPRQVTSGRHRLLPRGIGFIVPGEPPLRWKRGRLAGQDRLAEWCAKAVRRQGAMTVRGRLEYDGFCRFDVNLGKGSFKGLFLEIPIASRHARYLHFVNETHYYQQWGGNTLALPDREGELWSGRFACMAWLGDENVGLSWCADSDAIFRLRHPDRALTIWRSGDTTTLRVTLFDRDVTCAKPLHWRFGLIATPLRPMPVRWREWRLSPGASANMHILWWNSWTNSHADTEPKDITALTDQARKLREAGQYVLPYVGLLALSERTDVYHEGGDQWRWEPFSRMEDEGTPYWLICPNTPWRDYFPRQMEKLCRDTGINGLYFDWTFPNRCQAEGHPCGYVDSNDTRRGEFGVFALRELARTTYERVKRVNPTCRILMHTSEALMYPYIGFADLMLNGEQLRHPLAESGGHYMDVLRVESLRAEYRGQHAGLAPFLIPEFTTPQGVPDPQLTAISEPTSEMLALTLLHDIGVWPIYCHLETVEKIRDAQRAFGIGDSHFVPYWESGGPVLYTNPNLLASAWLKSDTVLVVIVNRAQHVMATEFQVRANVTDLKPSMGLDAISHQVIERTGAAFRVTVPARGFRLIRLSGNEAQ